MQVGDIIVRKSYHKDMKFNIISIQNHQAILNALNYRLIADAPLDDLEVVDTRLFNSQKLFKIAKRNVKKAPTTPKLLKDYPYYKTTSHNKEMKCGRILHLDGNILYFKKCCSLYKKLNLTVDAYCIEECYQAQFIPQLLQIHQPDILIITGHDAMVQNKRKSSSLLEYKNSQFFVESVQTARKINRNYDDLVIFAGGCQSNYEELMNAGANFASSPNRTLLNIYDPVYVATIVATTSITKVVDLNVLLDSGLFLDTDIGGLETRGKSRLIKPSYI